MGDLVHKPERWVRLTALIWLLILGIASMVLVTFPGFEVVSLYFSLAIGLLVALACGWFSALSLCEARRAGRGRLAGWQRAAGFSLIAAVLPLLIVLVSGLIHGPCDTLAGLAFYGMGPVVSAISGMAFGGLFGALLPRAGFAIGAFVLVVLGSLLTGLRTLYQEPAVFAYDLFVGYFPGPIYDDLITIGPAYGWFRVWSLLIACTAVMLQWVLIDGRGRFNPTRRLLPWAGLAIGAMAASLLWGLGGALGFRGDRTEVERALPHQMSDVWCELHYGPAMPPEDAARILSDCGFRHRAAAAFFDVPATPPIHLYVYDDSDQKARLMGARGVAVTKPWLQEIHLDGLVPGDLLLSHEVAHVVAGRLASNFLAMPLHAGLIVDVGRLEGLAVAAAFAADGPSPHEWAAAMRRAGIDTDVSALMGGMGFWSQQPRRAYTVAGSFVRWLADEYGPQVLQEVARGGDLAQATMTSLPALMAAWHAFLDGSDVPMDSELVALAQGRFAGPGVLGRRCPIDRARRLRHAWEASQRGAWHEAGTCLDAALDVSPEDRQVARRLLLVQSLQGDRAAVLAFTKRLQDATPPPAQADWVAAADAWVLLEGPDEAPPEIARALLERAAVSSGATAGNRAVRIRLDVMHQAPGSAHAVASFLSGVGTEDLTSLMVWSARRPDVGVIHYLLGRNLVAAGRFDEAVVPLGMAWILEGHRSDLGPEIARDLGKAAGWVGDETLARRFLSLALDRLPYEGERLVIEEYLDRLRIGR